MGSPLLCSKLNCTLYGYVRARWLSVAQLFIKRKDVLIEHMRKKQCQCRQYDGSGFRCSLNYMGLDVNIINVDLMNDWVSWSFVIDAIYWRSINNLLTLAKEASTGYMLLFSWAYHACIHFLWTRLLPFLFPSMCKNAVLQWRYFPVGNNFCTKFDCAVYSFHYSFLW